jgi:hypothetical protein
MAWLALKYRTIKSNGRIKILNLSKASKVDIPNENE